MESSELLYFRKVYELISFIQKKRDQKCQPYG